MPLYEYVCETCGHTVTKLRKMADAEKPLMCQHGEADHPATHAMKRKVSRGTGFQLKGNGWYKDGYAK